MKMRNSIRRRNVGYKHDTSKPNVISKHLIRNQCTLGLLNFSLQTTDMYSIVMLIFFQKEDVFIFIKYKLQIFEGIYTDPIEEILPLLFTQAPTCTDTKIISLLN